MESSTAPCQLLRLLQLASPTLPVGAYAYSRGLEWATQAGWVRDEADAQAWILGQIEHVLAYLDIPVLVRVYHAWQQQAVSDVQRWNRYLYASRESGEIQAEENHLGRALARLLIDLDIPRAKPWHTNHQTTFTAMFALAAAEWQISTSDMCVGYAWAWTESTVASAIKLVPLGQTAGQRILSQTTRSISHALEIGQTLSDDDIGFFTPALAIASALHETQHTRLFRS